MSQCSVGHAGNQHDYSLLILFYFLISIEYFGQISASCPLKKELN